MMDQNKSKQQLIDELAELRHRVATLEEVDTQRQSSEERNRLLMESIPQTVWRAGANGEASDFSNHWYEYTGQTCEEARGFGWMKALHPDDVEGVLERIRAAGACRELYQAEYRVRQASDGGYRWHLGWGRPMKDKDGNILYWFGSVTDIDDQKRTEEELRKNRAILRATIDNLPFDFFAIGMDDRYMLQNTTSKAHWGDAVGKLPEDMAGNEENLVIWRENNRRAFAGENVEEEVALTVKGEKRYYHNVIAPIIDAGQIQGILRRNVDITERKRAEETLRESEERLRKVFEEGPIGVVLVSTDGRIQRANRCFCEMLGCAESEIIAVGLAGISRPDDWERDYPFVSRLWRGEISSYHAEKRYLRKDGQVVWTQLMVSLMHDEAGRPINSIGMVEDITERKQVEEALKKAHNELERRVQERTAELAEANQWLQREVEERKAVEADLRESEEKYKTLVETSPDAVILADLTGHATFVSSRFLEIYGAETADEVMGKTAWDNIAPEDHEKGRVYFRKTLEDGITRGVEYTFIRKDGTRIPVELSAALVKDASGKPMAIISVLRNITERKRAEEQLARLAGIVESSQDGIIGGTLDGVVIAWNAGAERLYGYTAEEAIGQQIRFLVSPDRPDETVELRARIARGEVLEPYETVRRRKDGTLIDVSMTLSPIRNGGGRIVGVSSIARDITERRRAEEALQREHRTLRHLLESSDHERQLIAYEIHDGLAQYLAGAIMQFDVYKHLRRQSQRMRQRLTMLE